MADKQPERTDATTLLPLSRVRTIMKSSPDVSNIGQDALFAISKATELFVQELSVRSNAHSKVPNKVEYNDLAEIVDEQETLQFLQDTIPKKITVREYYALMGKKDKGEEEGEAEES